MKKSNKKKFFKNKFQMVVYIIIFCLLMYGFIYFGSKDYKDIVLSDNEKFAKEYNVVSDDNVFKYVDASFVYNYLSGNDAIILFGVSNNEWVGYYAKILNEVAHSLGINSIYFYDISNDRLERTGTYESIVDLLKNYVSHLDDGSLELFAPTFVVKKNGIITYFDDETSIINGSIKPDIYWNNYETNLKFNELTHVLNDYLGVDYGKKK